MVKLISFHPQENSTYIVGHALVSLQDKCFLVINICRSKTGNIFASFPNVKIDGEWKPMFNLSSKDQSEKILNETKELVTPFIKQESPKDTQQFPF